MIGGVDEDAEWRTGLQAAAVASELRRVHQHRLTVVGDDERQQTHVGPAVYHHPER